MDLRCRGGGGGVSRIAISHLPQMSAGIPPSIPPTIIPPPLPSALDPRNGTDRHNPVRVIFISLGGELNGKSGEKEASSVVHNLLTTLVGYAVKPKPAP